MMVTFVSQCEKKALNKTRRVLDSFANRIGDTTWLVMSIIGGVCPDYVPKKYRGPRIKRDQAVVAY